ncbi:hypothetical protein WG66_007762 [Moniliophthora roreri]|nr:hypothetical protein WG66_007762 [Moniliophthora roreri]
MLRAVRHDHGYLTGTGHPYPYSDVDSDEEIERNTALNAKPRRTKWRERKSKGAVKTRKAKRAPSIVLNPAIEARGWGVEKAAYPDFTPRGSCRPLGPDPYKQDYLIQRAPGNRPVPPDVFPPWYSGSVKNIPLPAPNDPQVNPVLTPASRVSTLPLADPWPIPLYSRPVGNFAVPDPPPRSLLNPSTTAVLAPPLPRPKGLQRLLPQRKVRLEEPPKAVYGPPPVTWRADFKRDPSLLQRICADNGVSLSSVKLHPFLRYKSRYDYGMSSDLRSPGWVLRHDEHRDLSRADNYQLATVPALRFMRLYHPLLPWYVDIMADDPSGITVKRVIETLRDELARCITTQDFYNDTLTPEDRERIRAAHKDRSSGDYTRKVDFLMNQTVFNGLIRGRDSMWLIRSSRIDGRMR